MMRAKQVPGNKHKHTFVSPGSKCRWPQKATRIVLDLVKNAESNAEVIFVAFFLFHVRAFVSFVFVLMECFCLWCWLRSPTVVDCRLSLVFTFHVESFTVTSVTPCLDWSDVLRQTFQQGLVNGCMSLASHHVLPSRTYILHALMP